MRSLSDAQLKRLEAAAQANDPVLYYELLSKYGFGYGKLGLEVATNTGVYGRIANNYLENKMSELGMKYSADLRNRLVSRLMQADLLYRRREDIVTVEHLATYHRQVFGDLHIPLSAWTGAFLDDRGAQALFCPTCTEAELAGHSRLGALREISGDVIDDLTNEASTWGRVRQKALPKTQQISWRTCSLTASCHGRLTTRSPIRSIIC